MKAVAELARMAAKGDLVFNVVEFEQSMVFEVVRVRELDDGKASLLVSLSSYDRTDIPWSLAQGMIEVGVYETIAKEMPRMAGKIGNIELLLKSPPPSVRAFDAADPAREIIMLLRSTGMTPVDALAVLSDVNMHVAQSLARYWDEGDDEDDGDDDGPRPPEPKRPFRARERFDPEGFGR